MWLYFEKTLNRKVIKNKSPTYKDDFIYKK